MKAYFINLDSAVERCQFMTRTLDKLGVPYERIAAVDGRYLADSAIARHYRQPPGSKPLDRGTIACFLSHREVWRRIANAEEPFGLVLEDDILFGEDATTILADPSWIPADAQIVRLETVRRHTVYCRKPVARMSGRSLVRLIHTQHGSGAYFVSRTVSNSLLERTEQFGYSVDNVLSNPKCPEFCGMEVLQVVPALCIQSAVAPASNRVVFLPSTLQQARKSGFATGLPRLLQKAERELAKVRLILAGLFLDRFRGQRTARIPFR